MAWEIVAGMVTLIGAVISVGSIIFKLSQTLTRLNISVDNLTRTLTDLTSRNDKEHVDIYDVIDEVADKVNGHEIRIHDLERDKKDNKNYSPTD